MADTGDLKSLAFWRAGSSPAISTTLKAWLLPGFFFLPVIVRKKLAMFIISIRQL